MAFQTIKKLVKPAGSKMVLLVMDGLGGLPLHPGDLTELEKAKTPNLDNLAGEGICGLHQPIAAGITPGSGPAHLALFGYDPLKYVVGRGVLSALGIGFTLHNGDVAARGNFCTVDDDGRVIDRRAGRIPTEKNRELCQKLRKIALPGVELFIEPVKDYRFLLVMRGQNLSGELADTDPQVTGLQPLPPRATSSGAEQTAILIGKFIKEAGEILAAESPANMVLLRGFSQQPDWPLFPAVFGLKAAAIAAYPMYRGVSRLVGMDILETGSTLEEELQTLKNQWTKHDFFYFHVKETDSAGEDGDFNRKVAVIEKVDRIIPEIMALKPDVIVVTGDHSTPALLKSHSWHPVPVLLHSKCCLSDNVAGFGERTCVNGALGPRFRTTELLPLMLANANRLVKFGA
ncbi:MAG: 2,3-bisphosphoglycerate-independent phosphoglycerate mutase [Bacillota bacterium]|nr:2,3-bisphosphoglycerate-independent phosphoglycerate mutase [Bacillota bacterium]